MSEFIGVHINPISKSGVTEEPFSLNSIVLGDKIFLKDRITREYGYANSNNFIQDGLKEIISVKNINDMSSICIEKREVQNDIGYINEDLFYLSSDELHNKCYSLVNNIIKSAIKSIYSTERKTPNQWSFRRDAI